jgi:hypothetical protein
MLQNLNTSLKYNDFRDITAGFYLSRKGSAARAPLPQMPRREPPRGADVPVGILKRFSFLTSHPSSTSTSPFRLRASSRGENLSTDGSCTTNLTMAAPIITSIIDASQGYGHFHFAPPSLPLFGTDLRHVSSAILSLISLVRTRIHT